MIPGPEETGIKRRKNKSKQPGDTILSQCEWQRLVKLETTNFKEGQGKEKPRSLIVGPTILEITSDSYQNAKSQSTI